MATKDYFKNKKTLLIIVMNPLDSIHCDPEIWGKHFWYTMEAIACTLNDNNRKYIELFFNNLKEIIPCENCKHHYNEFFEKNNVNQYLNNSLSLFEWLYKLKCEIKKRQNREIPSFANYFLHVIEYYDVDELLNLVQEKLNHV